MNAIELLEKDHKTVKSLFESFEKAKEKKDLESKSSLFTRIKGELEAHTRAEEEIFYPAFDRTAGEESEDDKELVLEAGEEHLQVKTLLAELSDMKPDDELFDAKMKVMKDNIDHHVEEEEGEMFPHAQKQLSSDELDQLGQQMDALKDRIKKEGPATVRKPAVKSARGKSGRTVRAASASRRADSSTRSRSSRPSGSRSPRSTRSAAGRSKSSRPSRSR